MKGYLNSTRLWPRAGKFYKFSTSNRMAPKDMTP